MDRESPEPRTDRPAADRMLSRRSPIDRSQSSLVSRDYQPRHGGPELIASWPLGPAPSQDELGDVDWEIDTMEYTLIQKNTLQLPYLGPLDYAPLYLNVCGRGYVEPDGAVLSLSLADTQLSGKAYRTTLELENDTRKPFASSMIEVAPETTDETHAAYDKPGHLYGGYELKAKVSDGTGYIDQGTCVQVWSE